MRAKIPILCTQAVVRQEDWSLQVLMALLLSGISELAPVRQSCLQTRPFGLPKWLVKIFTWPVKMAQSRPFESGKTVLSWRDKLWKPSLDALVLKSQLMRSLSMVAMQTRPFANGTWRLSTANCTSWSKPKERLLVSKIKTNALSGLLSFLAKTMMFFLLEILRVS